MKELILMCSCFLISMELAIAQSKTVSGTVTDEAGESVIGASVLVKNHEAIGTITDLDGHFTLEVPASAQTLRFKYLGMLDLEAAIQPIVNVVLHADSKSLDEIVVVGYGTQKKKDVTSSIVKIGGEDIHNLSTPSFESQLAGRAAGVQITTPSGIVGVAPEFQIRGYNTISSGSQPLIVIDGIPVTSGQKQQLSGRYNPLADINPNDIQSIEILKDGAATAIYGSRAANGVVLITTKKGSKGKLQVTYDGFAGFSNASKLHKLLNAKEFVEISNEKYENKGSSGPAVFDPHGPDTNWNDYIYRTAFQQNHTIAATGGTEKSQYYASLGYSDQEGIVRASNQKRYTLSANVTQAANKWLQIGLNMQTARTILNGILNEENSLGSVGFASVRMLPNVAVFNPNDPTGYNIDAKNRKALGRGSNLSPIDDGILNIVWALDNNTNRSKSTRLIGGGFAEITFTKGLTLRTQAGIDYTTLDDFMKLDAESGDGLGSGGVLEDVNTIYYNWNWQNVLNFNRMFNDIHTIAATLVQEYTHTDYSWVDAFTKQISDSFFTNHIISGTFGEKSVGGFQSENGLASYLFRVNYNYDSKYYVGGSVRRDGLSRLPKNTRWGTFAGGSLAWRLSREDFWTSSWFNDLRLRASLATIGNADLGSDFPYLGTYSPKQYGNESGIGWSNMGNDRLKWESTTTYDLGIDGSLLKGRVAFELAYFQKNTKDLVLQVPSAPSLGIPHNRYYDNVGKIKNSGFEFSINGTPVSTSNFSWNADLNFSFVKNKVIKLVNGADIIVNHYNIIREGEAIDAIYGFNYYGVNKENGNPVWRKADGSLVQFDTFGSYDYAVYDPAHPADVSQKANLSATEDRSILGSSSPSWFGGFNNTFTYKNFDLAVFFRFSGGNKIMNASRQTSLLNLNFANNGKEILGRWQSKEKQGDGLTPRIGYNYDTSLFNNGFADSHFVEDGSFLKLSNLTLGYTLPHSLLSKLDITKVHFYVQGQNLFTLTKYKGLDPETFTRSNVSSTSGHGVDWDGLPQQRIFTMGVNVIF
jgi:TonB-linked SusC/RagA family outer membrane protein